MSLQITGNRCVLIHLVFSATIGKVSLMWIPGKRTCLRLLWSGRKSDFSQRRTEDCGVVQRVTSATTRGSRTLTNIQVTFKMEIFTLRSPANPKSLQRKTRRPSHKSRRAEMEYFTLVATKSKFWSFIPKLWMTSSIGLCWYFPNLHYLQECK